MATPITSRCPVCEQVNLLDRGTIYHSISTIAGVEVDLTKTDFHLIACPSCGFQFKSPPISEEQLQACYAKADSQHWDKDVDPLERNFDIVAAAIHRHKQGQRILDIGCFTGAFLHYLGSSWQRFGVELSEAASQVAAGRGITLLGKTIEDVPQSENESFDVIVAMDVVEHLVELAPFFKRVGQLLRPGGIFVVTTADTNAIGFRMQGARYWYVSYLPEHFSFYSRRTMGRLAEMSQMKSIEHRRMSHKRSPLLMKISQGIKGFAFPALMHARWLGVPALRRRFEKRAGTIWITSRDHMVHVMQRKLGPTR